LNSPASYELLEAAALQLAKNCLSQFQKPVAFEIGFSIVFV